MCIICICNKNKIFWYMRNSRNFRDLLVQYLQCPYKEKEEIFKKMEQNAQKFFDYAMLFQFGDSDVRDSALKKMKETFLDERYSIQVQQNVLDLMSAIKEVEEDYGHCDISKEAILEKFFRKHNETKENLLFYLAESEDLRYEEKAEKKLKHFYKTESGMQHGIFAKRDRDICLYLKSPFGMNSLDVLSEI